MLHRVPSVSISLLPIWIFISHLKYVLQPVFSSSFCNTILLASSTRLNISVLSDLSFLMCLQIIVIFQTSLTVPTSSQKFGVQNSEGVRLWNDFPALLHLEGIVMLTAENSISVELLTDCLLRFVPSGTVPNTSIASFSGTCYRLWISLCLQVTPESSLHR